MHVEAPHDRAHRGQIFLILRGDAGAPDRAAAVRTGRGERRGVGHIHARGNRAARPATIPDAGTPSRPPTPALWSVLGERRGLPKARAPRHVELLLQARILLLQSVALAFYGAVLARRPHQRLAQTRNVFLLAPDQIVAVLAGPARRLVSHTRFMADSREKYKYETVSFSGLILTYTSNYFRRGCGSCRKIAHAHLANTILANPLLKHLGNGNAAVGLLSVFENGD